MPKACDVHGFTDWFNVGKYCVKYFYSRANFTDAEVGCSIFFLNRLLHCYTEDISFLTLLPFLHHLKQNMYMVIKCSCSVQV